MSKPDQTAVSPFRILRVERINDEVLEEVILSRDNSIENGATYSTLLGINGVGKSRFLGDLARTFTHLERALRSEDPSLKSSRLPFVSIEYIHSGNKYFIYHSESGLVAALKNGSACDLPDIQIPRKVISLTISAFDKFPLPSRPIESFDERYKEEYYSYIGARGRFGRAGSTELLLNAVENLLRIHKERDLRRLGLWQMFDFLGYYPDLILNYRWTIPQSILANLFDSGDYRATRIKRLIERGVVLEWELERALEIAHHHDGGRKFISCEISFSKDGDVYVNDSLPQAIILLRSLGAIRLRDVKINHKSGKFLNLMDASSGELSIVTNFLGLGSALDDGCLVLIDEPEISLHPEWQATYLELFRSTFQQYSNCHYVIATHSPLIVSDARPSDTHVTNLDHRGHATASELSGQSSDLILARAFGIVDDTNFYLKDLLSRCLRLAGRGQTESEEFTRILADLQQLLPQMSEDSVSKSLILGLLEARDSSTRDK